MFQKGITCSCAWLVKMSFNLKRLSTYRTLINNILDNFVPPVNSADATYSVVARAGGLRKFSNTKKLTLSDMLQEARYNSEEDFKKVLVVFSAIGLPQREFWQWAFARDCMTS